LRNSRKTSTAFVPPKPKELERAALHSSFDLGKEYTLRPKPSRAKQALFSPVAFLPAKLRDSPKGGGGVPGLPPSAIYGVDCQYKYGNIDHASLFG
jgi:hypothetical protein